MNRFKEGMSLDAMLTVLREEAALRRARGEPEPPLSQEQRISFVYGNTVLSNPDITRALVAEEAKKLDAK